MPDRLEDPPAPGDRTTDTPVWVVGQPVSAPRAETVRLYATDWLDFLGWCRLSGCQALPASAETFSAYLLAMAPGLSRGALGRRCAAIGRMHRLHGLLVPRLDAPSRAALRRMAKSNQDSSGAPPRDAAALTRAALRCPRDLAGRRDRALLLLAAATDAPGRRGRRPGRAVVWVTRQALLALTREQVRFVEVGMELQLLDEDAIAQGSPILVARATSAASCPVRAMEDWLRASDTRFGPAFRKVDRWGSVDHTPLAPDGLRRVIARRSEPPRRRVRPAKNS